jgi:hypothetical protein
MSHKFMNDLTVILGSCELLKDPQQDSPECKRRLEVIWEVAHGMVEELKAHQCQLERQGYSRHSASRQNTSASGENSLDL